MIIELACNWTKCVLFQNYFASSTELCCNNFIWTPMCVKPCSMTNVCNLWWRCLIMYGLGCMLVESRSFEVSSDYRVYMGSSPLAWLRSWSLIHSSSYKLDGSVTEANPEKVSAITKMGLIRDVKGVQKVTSCLAALRHFISRVGKKRCHYNDS